jgi:hypothetical protein
VVMAGIETERRRKCSEWRVLQKNKVYSRGCEPLAVGNIDEQCAAPVQPLVTAHSYSVPFYIAPNLACSERSFVYIKLSVQHHGPFPMMRSEAPPSHEH